VVHADLAKCKELLFVKADMVGAIFGAYEIKACKMLVEEL
jgi:hypothetical protein